jgi:YegS/Rv2252/BmrU family lipid kinase
VRALLVINPRAGRRKKSPIADITGVFDSQQDYTLDIHKTTGPGDATIAARKASEDGYHLVIAAGGDGSIFEVANGLVGSETALGVVPVGTENVLAREMGVPLDPRKACEFMLMQQPRIIDTGRVGDQHFVCFAGIGFDAHVAHRLSSERKKRFGALAYVFTSAEKFLPYQSVKRHLKLTLDGDVVEMDFWIMVISNIRSYGGRLIPAPEAVVDDGLLDVCVFPRENYLKLVRQMAAMKTGKHTVLPGVRYFQASRIEVESDPPEQLQLDGDAWPGMTPFVVEVVPKSLKVRF